MRLLGFGEVVVLADPAAMRRVLGREGDTLSGGAANSFGGLIQELAGEGSLLLQDGVDHARLRAAVAPALDCRGLQIEARARAAARRSIAGWPRGVPFALIPQLEQISHEVFAVAVLGVPEERREGAVAVLGEWSDAWNTPQVVLPVLRARWGRRRVWRRFVEARRALRRLIAEELTLGRAGAGREGSVAERLRSEESLADAEIEDQLLTLLVAGHHPTANALAWALELLIRHPAALARLRAELAAGSDAYLDAVVMETLRMRPVGQWMARRAMQPLEVCGGVVRAGALLVPNAFLAHHDEGLHPQAECYRPERFADGNVASEAWIPFGEGVRRCPGSGYATALLRGVLREVVSVLDVSPGRARPERIVPDGISLVPKHGVVAVATDR